MKMSEKLARQDEEKKLKVPFFIFIDFGIFIYIWVIDKVMFYSMSSRTKKIFVKMLSIFKAQCQ